MSDFNAKMHQNRFRLGLCPRPRLGSLQRSPGPLAGFKGPTSKGREGALKLAVCLLVLTILATGLALIAVYCAVLQCRRCLCVTCVCV